MIPFIKENIPKFGAELRWASLPLRCCYFPLFREGAERLSDLPGLTSLPGDKGIGGAGGIHQLRTCSFFNNQSHTPAEASGPTASLIKPEQAPVCSVRRASGSKRSYAQAAEGLCLSDQGPGLGGGRLGTWGLSAHVQTLHCLVPRVRAPLNHPGRLTCLTLVLPVS